MQWLRGVFEFMAHKLLYHSSLRLRVTTKKRRARSACRGEAGLDKCQQHLRVCEREIARERESERESERARERKREREREIERAREREKASVRNRE